MIPALPKQRRKTFILMVAFRSRRILPATSPIVVWKVTWCPAAIPYTRSCLNSRDSSRMTATTAEALQLEHVRRGPGGVIRLVDLLIRPSVPSRRNVIAADKRTRRQRRRFIAGSVTTVASHSRRPSVRRSAANKQQQQSAARWSCRSRDDSIKDEMSTTSSPHAWFWPFMSSGTLLSPPQ